MSRFEKDPFGFSPKTNKYLNPEDEFICRAKDEFICRAKDEFICRVTDTLQVNEGWDI